MTYSILISSRHLQTALELIVAVAIILSVFTPRLGASPCVKMERLLLRLARDRRRSIALAAAVPLALRLMALPWFPVPIPRVHDEFSYLLLGDTFAQGRLANPSPPEGKHFETEYVLVRPTYASQYQPAQGLFLAAGELLTGQPWWGVWAGVGLMCGTLCWALGYFFRPSWALFGSLAAALQFGVFGFWMNSYFGGAVAATGGALVFGSLLRMRRNPVSSSALCSLGLFVLLASRPFEGLLWAGVAACWIALHYRRHLRRIAPPALALLATAVASLAYYNFRVTGDPLDPPYALARRVYGTPQSFWWQPAVVVSSFSNPQLQENYRNQLALWNRRYSPAALWDSTWRRARDFWRFFIGPFLTPALLFVGLLRKRRRLRPWLWISVIFVAEHATYHAWYPQQSASETILIVLLIVQCWRHMRVWHRRRGWGLALSRNLVTGMVAGILLLVAGRAAESHLPARIKDIWASLLTPAGLRDHMVDYLAGVPGKHLVFVRYGPRHPYTDEWVFNSADIPNSKVVFSRLIDPSSDRALVKRLGDRDVWLADPDARTLTRVAAAY
jgi:hypothetical protein